MLYDICCHSQTFELKERLFLILLVNAKILVNFL